MGQTVKADYFVIGGGAMAMAFSDSILTETEATIAIVDRYHQPGGHWNTAYPYVRLHQPSAFYGVNSRGLGSDTVDQTGWNQGLYELATANEVCTYFDQIMQQQFLPSGRVQYFPMCDYIGEHQFQSRVSGEVFDVEAGKIVDSTYMNVTVPSMRAPAYPVEAGIDCIAPNELPKMQQRYAHYMIIGGGKTAMDACLFLLKCGLDPSLISWVMPRDSWLLDRANIQPGALFSETIMHSFAASLTAMATAKSIEELFNQLVETGNLLRFDDDVWPTMYRCATVTKAELQQLRRIDNIIRMGRVVRLSSTEIELTDGTVPAQPDTLYVDCTADGLANRPVEPIFAEDHLTLQSVRTCQQVFSAAFIGHIEASGKDLTEKNAICTPVPHPNTDLDYLCTNLLNIKNRVRWGQDPELSDWLKHARLDGFSSPNRNTNARTLPKELVQQVIDNLTKLIAENEGG